MTFITSTGVSIRVCHGCVAWKLVYSESCLLCRNYTFNILVIPCLYPPVIFSATGIFPLLDFVSAVTGWNISMTEALETGARIQTLRQLFNIREGVKSHEIRLPSRMAGIPPHISGPLTGITIDVDIMVKEYRQAMGWDPATAYPTRAKVSELGLGELTNTIMPGYFRGKR